MHQVADEGAGALRGAARLVLASRRRCCQMFAELWKKQGANLDRVRLYRQRLLQDLVYIQFAAHLECLPWQTGRSRLVR